jgi:hypothetical protein
VQRTPNTADQTTSPITASTGGQALSSSHILGGPSAETHIRRKSQPPFNGGFDKEDAYENVSLGAADPKSSPKGHQTDIESESPLARLLDIIKSFSMTVCVFSEVLQSRTESDFPVDGPSSRLHHFPVLSAPYRLLHIHTLRPIFSAPARSQERGSANRTTAKWCSQPYGSEGQELKWVVGIDR